LGVVSQPKFDTTHYEKPRTRFYIVNFYVVLRCV